MANARQRLALQKQMLGERHPDYATGLNQLALLLIMHNEPDQAEPLLRQALELRREILGERHPDYATNLSSLAGLLWARGDLDGSEPLLRRALEIRWEVLGASHPKSIASLNSLEQLLRAKEDWAGIERLAAGPPVAAAAPAAPVGAEPSEPAAVETPVEQAPATEMPAAEPSAAEMPAAEPSAAPPEPEAVPEPAPAEVPAMHEVVEVHSHPATTEPRPIYHAEPSQARADLMLRLEELLAEFANVGERLGQAAEYWKGGGAPPPETLISEMGLCRSKFEGLRADAIGLARSLDVPFEDEALTNLTAIGELLKSAGEEEGRRSHLEGVRGGALAVLGRILALKHADQAAFPPLHACQTKARERHEAIAGARVTELPEDTATLAEGEHSFHSLLRLVEGNELNDDVWASSMETVEREFGKPLGVAVARSKILS